MPRSPRKRSEADVYHAIVRGAGRKAVFEDDDDRTCFLRMLENALDKRGAEAFAWCLMSNHAHLLVKAGFDDLPLIMQGLNSGYATYYNGRYDHVGHVFSGRYTSVPIDTDEHLLEVVRYIHLNPVKGGLSRSCDYEWSSYRDYLGRPGFASTDFVLDVCGGVQQFIRMHENAPEAEKMAALEDLGRRFSESQAAVVAREVLGAEKLKLLEQLPRGERDAGIAELRRAGLSIRQIERLTGIGRGIISRVRWK